MVIQYSSKQPIFHCIHQHFRVISGARARIFIFQQRNSILSVFTRMTHKRQHVWTASIEDSFFFSIIFRRKTCANINKRRKRVSRSTTRWSRRAEKLKVPENPKPGKSRGKYRSSWKILKIHVSQLSRIIFESLYRFDQSKQLCCVIVDAPEPTCDGNKSCIMIIRPRVLYFFVMNWVGYVLEFGS